MDQDKELFCFVSSFSSPGKIHDRTCSAIRHIQPKTSRWYSDIPEDTTLCQLCAATITVRCCIQDPSDDEAVTKYCSTLRTMGINYRCLQSLMPYSLTLDYAGTNSIVLQVNETHWLVIADGNGYEVFRRTDSLTELTMDSCFAFSKRIDGSFAKLLPTLTNSDTDPEADTIADDLSVMRVAANGQMSVETVYVPRGVATFFDSKTVTIRFRLCGQIYTMIAAQPIHNIRKHKKNETAALLGRLSINRTEKEMIFYDDVIICKTAENGSQILDLTNEDIQTLLKMSSNRNRHLPAGLNEGRLQDLLS